VTLRGRAEVLRRRQKLNAVFDNINGLVLDPEPLSHYSRYLCVLTSGYAEQSIKELVIEYCRARSAEQIVRFVSGQLRVIRNINKERLRQLLMSLDPRWWDTLEPGRSAELAALDSVVAVRNAISHGEDTGITMIRIREYFALINTLLDDLSDQLDPVLTK
jgi:hypothetical protein